MVLGWDEIVASLCAVLQPVRGRFSALTSGCNAIRIDDVAQVGRVRCGSKLVSSMKAMNCGFGNRWLQPLRTSDIS